VTTTKAFRRCWPGVCRVLGVALILFGAACSYWWFCKLAPPHRTLNSEWYALSKARRTASKPDGRL
jgi:hypothetical protein